MKTGHDLQRPFWFSVHSYNLHRRSREGARMRILLILIVIAAIFVVVQARNHDCKYDATLLNCVLGRTAPTAETPAPPPPPPAETPAPAAPAQ